MNSESRQARNARILQLAESGWLHIEIAKALGLCHATPGQVLRAMGRQDLCGYANRRARREGVKLVKRKPRTKRVLPPQDFLRSALDYDALRGTFTWKHREGHRPQRNGIAGKQAGGVNSKHGYYEIRIDNVLYYGHQVAWVWSNGAIPDGMEIDHRDMDRSNNRLSNLRIGTHIQNMQNYPLATRELPRGVFMSDSGGYEARFTMLSESVLLGLFNTVEDARRAYLSYARSIHGDFVWGDDV